VSQSRGELRARRRDLVREAHESVQLAVDDLVVTDLAQGRGVHVDGHGSRLVVDAMDARGGCAERLAGTELVRAALPADREPFADGATGEHVDADARAAVVVESGIARRPPLIEPALRVLVAPEQLERPVTVALERTDLDELGSRASELHALVRREIALAERESFEACTVGHGGILHRRRVSRRSAR